MGLRLLEGIYGDGDWLWVFLLRAGHGVGEGVSAGVDAVVEYLGKAVEVQARWSVWGRLFNRLMYGQDFIPWVRLRVIPLARINSNLENKTMPKYLMQGSYSAEGLKGLMKDKATGRIAAVKASVKGMKGKLECMYFGCNGADVVLIVDAPDNATVAGLSIAVGASGTFQMTVTTLLTGDEIDQALELPTKYRAPGADK